MPRYFVFVAPDSVDKPFDATKLEERIRQAAWPIAISKFAEYDPIAVPRVPALKSTGSVLGVESAPEAKPQWMAPENLGTNSGHSHPYPRDGDGWGTCDLCATNEMKAAAYDDLAAKLQQRVNEAEAAQINPPSPLTEALRQEEGQAEMFSRENLSAKISGLATQHGLEWTTTSIIYHEGVQDGRAGLYGEKAAGGGNG